MEPQVRPARRPARPGPGRVSSSMNELGAAAQTPLAPAGRHRPRSQLAERHRRPRESGNGLGTCPRRLPCVPTRAHRDLDLLVDAQRLEECMSLQPREATRWRWTGCRSGSKSSQVSEARWTCTRCGWLPTAVGCRPGRTAPGPTTRRTDLRTGNLAGREVPCLTAAHQRLLHTGYEPRPQHVHDLGLLNQLGPEKPPDVPPLRRWSSSKHQ